MSGYWAIGKLQDIVITIKILTICHLWNTFEASIGQWREFLNQSNDGKVIARQIYDKLDVTTKKQFLLIPEGTSELLRVIQQSC